MALTKVTRGGITADAIDGTKIDDDAINSEHYAATSVDNAHINDLAASKLTGALPAISAASLTSIPAANITGTLPAISGASLTALNATNLGSGTVPTARLGSGTASSSTVLYGDQTYKAEPAGGITEADTWRITSSLSIGADTNTHISANWERADTNAFGLLGTGMTESSGIFSFPSTGHWLVSWKGSMSNSAVASRYMRMICYVTVNDSTYVWAGDSIGSAYNSGSSSYYTPYCDILLDVTDISNIKVKFHAYGITSTVLSGDTNSNGTYANFIKLGDT